MGLLGSALQGSGLIKNNGEFPPEFSDISGIDLVTWGQDGDA
jgi:hypothetical protein